MNIEPLLVFTGIHPLGVTLRRMAPYVGAPEIKVRRLVLAGERLLLDEDVTAIIADAEATPIEP